MLVAKHLSKKVLTGESELTILDDVSFSLDEGSSLAIVGASGSGKTTLLGLLAALDEPSSGSVHLFGADLFALDDDAQAKMRMQNIGFVFQSFQLVEGLTALENVALPLEIRGDTKAGIKAEQMLREVGLEHRLQHMVNRLSGGEQQRVALARAFVTRPKLLLADEPTGNLDTETGAHIIELMFSLNRQYATTLVLVTHDIELARRCDKQLKLAAGRVVSE